MTNQIDLSQINERTNMGTKQLSGRRKGGRRAEPSERPVSQSVGRRRRRAHSLPVTPPTLPTAAGRATSALHNCHGITAAEILTKKQEAMKAVRETVLPFLFQGTHAAVPGGR